MRTVLGSVNDVEKNIKRLTSQARLSEGTEVKSDYERAFKECLIDRGVRTGYEPVMLTIDTKPDKWGLYLPDFITSITVADKQVVLEPHPMLWMCSTRTKMDVLKFKAFKQRYGDTFFFVVASDLSAPELQCKAGLCTSEFSDEYWMIPHLYYGPNSFKRLKESVSTHLDELIRKQA